MHHLPPDEAAAHLAAHAHPRADRELLLLRRIEVEEAQLAGVAAVVHRHDQLAARAEHDLAVAHHGLDLGHVAVARVGQPHDARLVLVAHRQVEREIDVAQQAELAQRALHRAQARAGRRRRLLRAFPVETTWRRRAWDNSGTWHGPVRPSSTMRAFTLSDFDFDLPPELVAQHPAAERSASRLLDGTVDPPVDRIFKDLPSQLRAGDLLVFNDTRVVKARLFGEKPTGGKLELLVERVLQGHEVVAHMKVSKKPPVGTTLAMIGGFSATLLGRWPDEHGALFRFRFDSPAGEDPYALMARCGHVPLPPYIDARRLAGRRAPLPDRVRARAGRGRRADRGAAFRRGPARRARGARRAARQRHAARRRRHLPAGEDREHRRAHDARRALRGARDHAARHRRNQGARRPHRRRRHDHRAHARIVGQERRSGGRHAHLHHAGLRLRARRPAGHQLPPAQEHAHDAGERLRGLRARDGALCPRDPRALPLLQLRRRDAS